MIFYGQTRYAGTHTDGHAVHEGDVGSPLDASHQRTAAETLIAWPSPSH